jgi:hypothetical protein
LANASATSEQHGESPEKLSLKARLKLFEKEIEQQGSAPAPKPGESEAILSYQMSTFLIKSTIGVRTSVALILQLLAFREKVFLSQSGRVGQDEGRRR